MVKAKFTGTWRPHKYAARWCLSQAVHAARLCVCAAIIYYFSSLHAHRQRQRDTGGAALLTFVLTPRTHTPHTHPPTHDSTHVHASLDAHCCLNWRWGEITQFISADQQSGAGLSGKTTMRRWRLLYINKPKERARKEAGYDGAAMVGENRIKLLTMPQNKRKNIA